MSKNQAVLVVGSGNAETVLDLNSDLVQGQKHNVKRVELFGGSGVNYTLRLLQYDGTWVLPILSIGEDVIGKSIQQAVLDAMAHTHTDPEAGLGVSGFCADSDFLCRGLITPQSTVITVKDLRTIFREEMRGAEHFRDFAERRLAQVRGLHGVAVDVGAVMIGHIYADRPGLRPGDEGSITRTIIDQYWDRAILFANFGESQYCLGCEFWEDLLPRLTAFQLSIEEARGFFGCRSAVDGDGPGRTPLSLYEMVLWFQERHITAVITLDRFGAVATFRGQDGVLFAPAFELDHFEDSTGAGDAFGAGLVHTLCRAPCVEAGDAASFGLFQTALKQARIWAAHACTTRGATSQCPSKGGLADFEAELRHKGQDPDLIDCRDLAAWEGIFRILDKAY